jgi:hypothetical protein
VFFQTFPTTPLSYPSQCIPVPKELNNWINASYNGGRSTQDETKHTKESEHWFNQNSASNRYTALLEEESEDQQQKAGQNLLQSL